MKDKIKEDSKNQTKKTKWMLKKKEMVITNTQTPETCRCYLKCPNISFIYLFFRNGLVDFEEVLRRSVI